MIKFVQKLTVGALAVGLVAGAYSLTASANSLDTTTTVEGGSLSINEVGITAFSNIVLSGSTQETTTTVNPFSVIDATGTGSGWNLSVQASQLTSLDGGTLPQSSLSISAPTVTAQEGSSEASTITAAGGNIDTTTGVKLLTASVGGGMGTFDFTNSDLTLKLQPKAAKAGTYTSTVTFNLVTGP